MYSISPNISQPDKVSYCNRKKSIMMNKLVVLTLNDHQLRYNQEYINLFNTKGTLALQTVIGSKE